MAFADLSFAPVLASKRRIGMEDSNRRLMWHGMFLFLLGLFTGFAEPNFANVRMGLAAHLEGVMNGTFLVALGAIWPHVRLAARAKTIAYWAALYGTYMNWFVTTRWPRFLARRRCLQFRGRAIAGNPGRKAWCWPAS